ncbi:MAG TPA: hypothetical protein VFJ51_04435 [Nitrososphaeraceae archaeon]|nr:hypothetical protein [Nitrososphaeraceae archaeon]
MSLDMFANMFCQRRGIDQSIAASVMNAIMGHATQQGVIGNLFSDDIYDNYTDDDRMGGIQSTLSNIMGVGDTLQQDHFLVFIRTIPVTFSIFVNVLTSGKQSAG